MTPEKKGTWACSRPLRALKSNAVLGSHGEPPNRTHQEQVYDSLEEEHPGIVDI